MVRLKWRDKMRAKNFTVINYGTQKKSINFRMLIKYSENRFNHDIYIVEFTILSGGGHIY